MARSRARITITMLLAALALAATLGAHSAVAASYTPYSGYTSDGRPIVVHIANDGRQVVLARTVIDLDCSNGTSDTFPDFVEQLVLSKSGAFKAGFSDFASTSEDGRPTVSSGSVSGKVDAKRRRLTGTWFFEVTTTQADGSSVTCKTERIKFSAAAKSKRGPAVAGFYGSAAPKQNPMVVEVARDGRSVRSAVGMFDLKCPDGLYRFVSDSWARMPLSKSGKFKDSVTNFEQKFSDGTPYRITASITGSVDRAGRKLTGTWRVAWTMKLPDGSDETCDSGPVKFTAKR